MRSSVMNALRSHLMLLGNTHCSFFLLVYRRGWPSILELGRAIPDAIISSFTLNIPLQSYKAPILFGTKSLLYCHFSLVSTWYQQHCVRGFNWSMAWRREVGFIAVAPVQVQWGRCGVWPKSDSLWIENFGLCKTLGIARLDKFLGSSAARGNANTTGLTYLSLEYFTLCLNVLHGT